MHQCPHCENSVPTLRWQRFADGTLHIREDCWQCGRFYGYVKQTADAIARAEHALGPDGSLHRPRPAERLLFDGT